MLRILNENNIKTQSTLRHKYIKPLKQSRAQPHARTVNTNKARVSISYCEVHILNI